MTPTPIGILHPGAMGISVAASARNGGHTVYWASEGRSPETHTRADEHDLTDAGTLASLCAQSAIVVSVCPPHAAEDVARSVIETGFSGLYVDANAIAPQRAERIAQMMADAGIRFVDGGIIGGPAWQPGTTWLYLSGPDAPEVAACFSAGPLETGVLGETIGRASALKMCYAAYTKGTTALLCAIVASAESLGVWPDLAAHWAMDGSDFTDQTVNRVRRVTAKAWRFAGEMEEIAATLDSAGTTGGFHLAAADLYRRLAHFKGAPETPSLDAVLAALLNAQTESG